MSLKKIIVIGLYLILIGLITALFVFSQLRPPEQSAKIRLYYYDADLDKDEAGNLMCSRQGLVAVDRQIPVSATPIQDTIKLLLKGDLTPAEKGSGIATEYPLPGLELKGATFHDGLLVLEFADPQNKTVGGACRVGMLWFQIEQTARQFPEVKDVKFIPEELFQP